MRKVGKASAPVEAVLGDLAQRNFGRPLVDAQRLAGHGRVKLKWVETTRNVAKSGFKVASKWMKVKGNRCLSLPISAF